MVTMATTMDKVIKRIIRNGNVSKFKKRIPNVKQSEVCDVVTYAVSEGTAEIVEAIPIGWFQNDFPSPLLNIAVKRNHDGICRCLLGRGIEPNKQDEHGYTSLYVACVPERINPVIVRLLIENNADPSISTDQQQTTYTLLERKNRPDVIKLIKEIYDNCKGRETRNDVMELCSEVDNLYNSIDCIKEKLSRLDYLATKQDVQDLASGTYVQLERSISADNPKHFQRSLTNQSSQKDHVYSYLECDFLEPSGSSRRSFSPEEQHHIKSKLTYVLTKLQCNELIKDITDRMYAKDSLSDEQMQIIRQTNMAKENARFIVINVIISGGKLHRFLAFIDALNDLGEEKMAKYLMTREIPPAEYNMDTRM